MWVSQGMIDKDHANLCRSSWGLFFKDRMFCDKWDKFINFIDLPAVFVFV